MVVQGSAFRGILHEALSRLQDYRLLNHALHVILTEHAGWPILDIDAVFDHEGLPPPTHKSMNDEKQNDLTDVQDMFPSR